MPESKRIDEMAEQATQRFLERSSLAFLECAVNLLLTHCSKARTIELLKAQIRMIREFD